MKNNIVLIILTLITGVFSGCDEDVSAPSDLTVVFVSSSEVRLTWKDNSHNESGFYVYLKTVPQDDDFVFIARVDENVTTFNDKGLISGTHYIYKVCSEIGMAAIPIDGSCSNEVRVTGP